MFVVLSVVSQGTAGNHHFSSQVNYFLLCRNLLCVILTLTLLTWRIW
jgi:hypothetical protein